MNLHFCNIGYYYDLLYRIQIDIDHLVELLFR